MRMMPQQSLAAPCQGNLLMTSAIHAKSVTAEAVKAMIMSRQEHAYSGCLELQNHTDINNYAVADYQCNFRGPELARQLCMTAMNACEKQAGQALSCQMHACSGCLTLQNHADIKKHAVAIGLCIFQRPQACSSASHDCHESLSTSLQQRCQP